MENEREFYSYDVTMNALVGMKLTDEGTEAIDDYLSGQEITSVGAQ